MVHHGKTIAAFDQSEQISSYDLYGLVLSEVLQSHESLRPRHGELAERIREDDLPLDKVGDDSGLSSCRSIPIQPGRDPGVGDLTANDRFERYLYGA